jgi:hypothetical protein
MRPYLWDRFRFSVFIHVARRKMCRELVRTFLARPYGRVCGGTRVSIVLETHAILELHVVQSINKSKSVWLINLQRR